MVLITCTILMVHLDVMPVTVELTKHKMQTKYYNTISFVLNSVFRTKNRPFYLVLLPLVKVLFLCLPKLPPSTATKPGFANSLLMQILQDFLIRLRVS